MGEYAALASHRGSTGLSAASMSEPGNGLPHVLLILGIEGPLLMALAWTLEQAHARGKRSGRWRPLHAAQRAASALTHERLLWPARCARGELPVRRALQQHRDAVGGGAAKPRGPEPVDVASERQRVASLGPTGDGHAIVTRSLSKTYAALDGQPPKVT